MYTQKNVLKAFLGLAFLVGVNSIAQNSVRENSKTMVSNKTIIDFAVNSKDHTTLVAAIKAADLVETLSGAGPFTVFAPTNAAFDKLPKGTVESLLKPENKEKLQNILTYHVVSGKFDSKAIAEAIKAGKGTATFITAQGGKISGTFQDKKLILTDNNGGKTTVTIADINQSNGIVHVIDSVVMP